MSYRVIDNFLNDYESFRLYCDDVDFKGEVNPVDNVFYPGVSIEIPNHIQTEIIERLENYFNKQIKPILMFMRLSLKGIKAPHQAHTDASMSTHAMMLYLNRKEHCNGGTSFVTHKQSGLCKNPINEIQENIWIKDTNNPDAWEITDMCPMKTNRAMVFDSIKMHRSEPIGGFGKGAKDGRLVLTFFFNIYD